MKAERIGLKRIGLQKIGLPRIGVMGAGASMRPTEIVGISYAREIGSIPSAMGNGLLTSEKWAKVSTLKGNSVVWNQLVDVNRRTTFGTASGVRAYAAVTLQKILPINHKLLATCKSTLTDKDGGTPDIEYRMYIGNTLGQMHQKSSAITNGNTSYFFVTPSTDTRKAVGVLYDGTPTEGDTLLVENIYVYDLTQMFGAGNEPTTIEEFEKRKPIGVTNDYNEGEIISYQQWGESVIWNQLTRRDISQFIFSNCSAIKNNDVYTITPTITDTTTVKRFFDNTRPYKVAANTYIYTEIEVNVPSGYKIGFGANASEASASAEGFVSSPINGTGKWDVHGNISKANTSDYLVYPAVYLTKMDVAFQLKRINIYDLTLMFGEGNEPTTIEEFERRRPRNVTDEYNEGTEINGDIEIKTVGLNVLNVEGREEVVTAINLSPTSGREINPNQYWNGVAGNGYTSSKACDDVSITSSRISFRQRLSWYGIAFPMDLIPEQNYRITYSANTPTLRVTIGYFDKNGVYISSKSSLEFTVPKDTKAVLYLTGDDKISYYIEGLCLHLVQDGLVSQYKPYTSTTTPLPNVSLIKDTDGNQLFPYGLCSAGSVYDEITETKAIKRVGVVDMGTKDWFYDPSRQYFRFNQQDFTFAVGVEEKKQLTCGRFSVNPCRYDGWIQNYAPDNSITSALGVSNVRVKYSKITDATSFKAAMQGVLLYYELATPIEVEIDKWKAEYKVEQGGTEQIVSANDTTNLKTDIIYGNKV